jgi:hypothetical protein
MIPEFYEINGKKYPVIDRDLLVRDPETSEYLEFKPDVIFVWKCEGYCVGFHLPKEAGTYYKADIFLSDKDCNIYGTGKTDNKDFSLVKKIETEVHLSLMEENYLKKEKEMSLEESALFDLSVSGYVLYHL